MFVGGLPEPCFKRKNLYLVLLAFWVGMGNISKDLDIFFPLYKWKFQIMCLTHALLTVRPLRWLKFNISYCFNILYCWYFSTCDNSYVFLAVVPISQAGNTQVTHRFFCLEYLCLISSENYFLIQFLSVFSAPLWLSAVVFLSHLVILCHRSFGFSPILTPHSSWICFF